MLTDFTQSSADGTVLRGVIFDPPKAPKAVMSLVHGFGEHCGRYTPMADYLRDQDIAVVALDLRGHGRSEGKRGVCRDYGHLRADVSVLVKQSEQVFLDIPHILYGHSMGGALVLNYVLNQKLNENSKIDNFAAIIASAPLLELSAPIPAPLKLIVEGLRKIAPELTLGQPISGAKVSTLPSEQAVYEQDPANHGRLGVGLAIDMVKGGHWVLEQARDWTLPLLLVHARQDQLTAFSASEAFANRAQNCEFIAFDNVEHEIHNDTSRADVYQAMRKFIHANI